MIEKQIHLKMGSKGWTHCDVRPPNPWSSLTTNINDTNCMECIIAKKKKLYADLSKLNKRVMDMLRNEQEDETIKPKRELLQKQVVSKQIYIMDCLRKENELKESNPFVKNYKKEKPEKTRDEKIIRSMRKYREVEL